MVHKLCSDNYSWRACRFKCITCTSSIYIMHWWIQTRCTMHNTLRVYFQRNSVNVYLSITYESEGVCSYYYGPSDRYMLAMKTNESDTSKGQTSEVYDMGSIQHIGSCANVLMLWAFLAVFCCETSSSGKII